MKASDGAGATTSAAHDPRLIDPDCRRDVRHIARLHVQLLGHGPMARLGEFFLRRFCYGVLLRDRVLRAALVEVEGEPVGFVSYTDRSITFHRSMMRRHWCLVAWLLLLSILRNPVVLLRLVKAARVIFSRRAERELGGDPSAEVVSIGVLPQYRTPRFVRRTGLRISEMLVKHAAAHFRRAGLSEMRMIVEADNKPTLFFYHSLGARFESYEQAGDPMVHVWFNLDELADEPEHEVPACWDVDVRASRNGAAESAGWRSYWEKLDTDAERFRGEANHFVQRLIDEVPLEGTERVLDWGCGFGLIASALAPQVRSVSPWDAAANMRRRARLNVAGHSNIRFVDLSSAAGDGEVGPFDLILVNSVIQYMSRDELAAWFPRWRNMLKPTGRLIISDVIPPDHRPVKDMACLLKFNARQGMVARAVVQAAGEVGRYFSTRNATPLFSVGQDGLQRLAATAGLEMVILPDNLTHFRRRYTAVFTRGGEMGCAAVRSKNVTLLGRRETGGRAP